MAIPSTSGAAPRRDHLRVVDEHAAVPVVLACASADAGDVESAVRPLGGDIEIEGGLERDPDALRHAAQRALRPTLFVVCKTAELTNAVVRRVVESFGGRTAAGHRLLVLELVMTRAAGFAGTLRRARAQLGRACERSGVLVRGSMRDSSITRTVGGETHYDHAIARSEPGAARISVAASGDRVGPIPPHVRVPERGHLAIVEDQVDTVQDFDAASFAELRPPELRALAAQRRAVDHRKLGVIAIVVAAVVFSLVVGWLV